MKRSLFIAQQKMPIQCGVCKEQFIPNDHTGDTCLKCIMVAIHRAYNRVKALEMELEASKKTSSASNGYYSTTGTGGAVGITTNKINNANSMYGGTIAF